MQSLKRAATWRRYYRVNAEGQSDFGASDAARRMRGNSEVPSWREIAKGRVDAAISARWKSARELAQSKTLREIWKFSCEPRIRMAATSGFCPE
jgi:hypothetical protein